MSVMAKQTIESRILTAVADMTGDQPGTTHTVSASLVSSSTGLTMDQVLRFRRKVYSKRIGGKTITRDNLGFRVDIDKLVEPVTPAKPAPEWFAPPVGEATRETDDSWRTGSHRMLARQICKSLRGGEYVLPPWQRGAVWTETQRVALLDSIMRGVSIGAITLWTSPGNTTAPTPFAGCPVSDHPSFVIDGQQRLTTIIMAASGDLDHWRWNGTAWTTGQGFLVPSQVVGRLVHPWGLMDWGNWVFDGVDKKDTQIMCDALDTLEQFNVTFMTIEGTVDHMVEVYRRLATFGSPHSVDDLAVMDQWLETMNKLISGASDDERGPAYATTSARPCSTSSSQSVPDTTAS